MSNTSANLFDGVSMEFVYEDGSLERAVTRGDGREGDDVTRNARTIGSVPQQLHGDHPDFLAVRGEVYMPKDAFQAHNRERIERGEEPFRQPAERDRRHDPAARPSVVAERPLAVFTSTCSKRANSRTRIGQNSSGSPSSACG